MKSLLKKFLRFLAKRILVKYHPEVVGITGSVGKTGVKEIACQILGAKFRVSASADNYNTEMGVLLTVIGMRSPGPSWAGWVFVFFRAVRLLLIRTKKYPEFLIMEMAAGEPGDLQQLTSITPCSVGVVTAIAPVHLESFKTIEKIAREKRTLVSHLGRDGIAILNRDDARVFDMRGKTDADVVTFGFHPEADVRGSDVKLYTDDETDWPMGTLFKLTFGGSVVPMYVPGVLGEHSVYAALAAVAIAVSQGMNLVEISDTIRTVIMPPGRMRLIPGIKRTLIIDDSYNASPASVRSAIEALAQIPVREGSERYIVLGDMAELGTYTDDAHREVGLRVAEHDIHFFITVGEAMKLAAHAARESGMPEHRIGQFATAREAGKFLQEKIEPGDVVLIKGSRVMRMETVVKEIMAEPLQAEALLAD